MSRIYFSILQATFKRLDEGRPPSRGWMRAGVRSVKSKFYTLRLRLTIILIQNKWNDSVSAHLFVRVKQAQIRRRRTKRRHGHGYCALPQCLPHRKWASSCVAFLGQRVKRSREFPIYLHAVERATIKCSAGVHLRILYLVAVLHAAQRYNGTTKTWFRKVPHTHTHTHTHTNQTQLLLQQFHRAIR